MSRVTFNFKALPAKEQLIDLVGSAIETPRSTSGISTSIDFSGGGMWKVDLKQLQIYSAASHLYYNQLASRLNGGVENLILPFITDYIAPVFVPGSAISGQTVFSDGTSFSDAAQHKQSNITIKVDTARDKGSGTIRLRVLKGNKLYGGEFFSINHGGSVSWRAYRISRIERRMTVDGHFVYLCDIRPTLRADVRANTEARFDTVKCLMRVSPGTTMPWRAVKFYEGLVDASFVEAFG